MTDEQAAFLKDAAEQVLQAYLSQNPDELRETMAYLARCLSEIGHPSICEDSSLSAKTLTKE